MPADETIATPSVSAVERLKLASHGLYGPLPEEIRQDTDHFSEDAAQLLKHHGAYQQDNRDTRIPRKKQGLDREYTMMLRTKFPGGRITAEQYLVCDDLATRYGRGDMRATSRQCLQFHGVVKGSLRPLIRDLDKLAKITALGACGDVVRNTTAPPVADIDPAYAALGVDLQALARDISDRFLPRTRSYYDLWLDDEAVDVGTDGAARPAVDEPLYGQTYLPRKFKIGIATDFDNNTDVLTNDIAIIAVTNRGMLTGFDILVGGGLGHSHARGGTYPRLASPLAFVEQSRLFGLLEAIIKVQRDFGGRENRKHARMKYLIDDIGPDEFRKRVVAYAGQEYAPVRGSVPSATLDILGLHPQHQSGRSYFGVWVPSGRIADIPGGGQYRSGLRAVIEKFRPEVRFTPDQNVVLANLNTADIPAVEALLHSFGIAPANTIPKIRLAELACPALPLCPLATSEAERVFPAIMQRLVDAGHGDAEVTVRISGCPNGCSRPATAGIGIVGKGPGQYILSVGGSANRMNRPVLDPIKFDDLAPAIGALLDAWQTERTNEESFSDWTDRWDVDRLREVIAQPVS